MRTLTIIKSCHRHADRRLAVTATWLPQLRWDRIFALGVPPTGVQDTLRVTPNAIQFPVSDSFKNIAPKVQAALTWGLKHGYERFFICDDDTYVVPDRLTEYECHADYAGKYRPDGGYGYPKPYIQGSAFFLSQRAAELVAVSPEMRNDVPDDIAVGRALDESVVLWYPDARFHPGPVPEFTWGQQITTHKCLPDDMRRIHAQNF